MPAEWGPQLRGLIERYIEVYPLKHFMKSPGILYCEHMEQIKGRLSLIEEIHFGRTTIGNPDHDAEMICLQLRKILELIVFASLVSNKDKYSELYENYSSHWRIKRIIESLEKANPNFYPISLMPGKLTPNNVLHFDRWKSGFLTKDQLISLYENTSEILHTWNPYKDQPRVVDFGMPIIEWVNHIKKLLDHHFMQPINSDIVWLIIMNDPSDGNVHLKVANGI